MLFNSIDFAIFFPVVFIVYWFVICKNLKLQNALLLLASYLFYAFWDWRFVFLLAFISFLNFSIGLIIQKAESKKRKKSWLIIGIMANIGALSYFKYFNFFFDNFKKLFSMIGFTLDKPIQNIILPLGISFYIFLSLSYIIDIYQNKLIACNDIIDVFLTFSFFPIILAGPIQRPFSLLPQIQKKRVFNYSFAVDGIKQILWGLFMKIVIADKCAVYVNNIFMNFNIYKGSTLFLGGIFFTIQIYSDFAGYSLIAIGISKLIGFNLSRNFANPYFARDIIEFWKRWHISLTNWFRDYVFLPISYNISRKIPSEKVGFIKADTVIYIVGIFITWFLTGLWHGGNYTFITWGFINGLFLIVYHILKKPRKKLLKNLKISKDNVFLIASERIFTLIVIILSWIVFRATNISQAWTYISKIFSKTLFAIPEIKPKATILLIIVFIFIELFGRNQQYAIENLGVKWPKPLRWATYYAIILVIFWFGGQKQQFIYFQF